MEATVTAQVSAAEVKEKSFQITKSKTINTKSPVGERDFFYERHIEIDFGGRVIKLAQNQMVVPKPMKETPSVEVDNSLVKQVGDGLGMDLFKPTRSKY